jgi:hypothetical protein
VTETEAASFQLQRLAPRSRSAEEDEEDEEDEELPPWGLGAVSRHFTGWNCDCLTGQITVQPVLPHWEDRLLALRVKKRQSSHLQLSLVRITSFTASAPLFDYSIVHHYTLLQHS